MHITIRGLGPHRSADITLSGTIARPSQWGKSTLVDLALWAITGRDRRGRPIGPEVIRPGTDRGVVTVTTPAGLVERRITARSSGAKLKGVTTSNTDLLAAIGVDQTTALLIGGPLYWRTLADGPRDGAALRDALVSLLADPARVEAEVRSIIPDYSPAKDGESVKRAKEIRRDANRARDEAAGAMRQAEAHHASIGRGQWAEPSAEHVAEAQAIIDWWPRHEAACEAREAADRWDRRWLEIGHTGTARPVEEVRAAIADAEAREAAAIAALGELDQGDTPEIAAQRDVVRSWGRVMDSSGLLDELGDDPGFRWSPEAVEAARETIRLTEAQDDALAEWEWCEDAATGRLWEAWDAAMKAASLARYAVRKAEKEAARAADAYSSLSERHAAIVTAEADAPACGTCGQPWPGALDQLEIDITTAEAAREAASEALDAVQSKCREAEATLAQAESQCAEANEAERAAESAYEAAKAALREHEAATRRRRDEEREKLRLMLEARSLDLQRQHRERQEAIDPIRLELAALRAELRAAELGPRPEAPEVPPAPSSMSLEDARRITKAAAEGEAIRRSQAHARQQAQEQVEKAREAHARAEAAASRAQTVVEALEAAPGTVLERELGELNSRLDGEEVTLSETGADLLVDGRAWHLASSGRQILADARLRLALRDLAGLAWLPVVVDDAALWSGAWPEGVVLLVTEQAQRWGGKSIDHLVIDDPLMEAERTHDDDQRVARYGRDVLAAITEPEPAANPTRIAVIDVETAGNTCDVCSLAVVIVDGDKIDEAAHWLIRPGVEDIMWSEVHGLTWDDLEDAPSFAEVWPEFLRVIEDCGSLAAHNASFDRRAILADCQRYDLHPEPLGLPWTCTMQAFRRARPGEKSSLPAACEAMGVDMTGFTHHDAMSDAKAAARLLIALQAD